MENGNIQVHAQSKKRSKTKWIIIAIVIVLFIAIVGSGSSETTVETSSEDNSVSQSAKIETTNTSTKAIKVGSIVSNNTVKVTYKSCNNDFKNYSRYADIKSGHKVIQAVFDFENISSSEIILDGFACYADGAKCESFFFVDDYSDPVLTSISAGRKLTDATVYYEIPIDAESIDLEYSPDYWSNEKYIFVVE